MYELSQEPQAFGISPRILSLTQEILRFLREIPASIPRSIHIKTEASGNGSANITCSWQESDSIRGTTSKIANLVAHDIEEEVVFQVSVKINGTGKQIISEVRGFSELASIMQTQSLS